MLDLLNDNVKASIRLACQAKSDSNLVSSSKKLQQDHFDPWFRKVEDVRELCSAEGEPSSDPHSMHAGTAIVDRVPPRL